MLKCFQDWDARQEKAHVQQDTTEVEKAHQPVQCYSHTMSMKNTKKERGPVQHGVTPQALSEALPLSATSSHRPHLRDIVAGQMPAERAGGRQHDVPLKNPATNPGKGPWKVQ